MAMAQIDGRAMQDVRISEGLNALQRSHSGERYRVDEMGL